MRPPDRTDEDKADLAQLAAMELLDLGWTDERIALALGRDLDWVRASFDRAALDAAGMLN